MISQFGTFDGLDNRKEVMRLFKKMGEGLPDDEACARRALFLQSLLGDSQYAAFAGRQMTCTPCTPTEAYLEFVNICGVFGVPIEDAAKKLEKSVRKKLCAESG